MKKPWKSRKAAVAEQPKGMTIEQALQEAYGHWNAGQAAQAEHLCRQVLAVSPEQPDALHLLGLLAHTFKNLPLAIDYLRRACAAPRAPAVFHSNLTEMLRQAGQLAEAEAVGRRAVSLDARNAGAWNNLGIVLQESGKLEESLQCLLRVAQLAPDQPENHNNLGNTYKRLGRLHGARKEYEKAVALNPSYSEAFGNLAYLLNELGQLDEAMASARKAIKLNPRNANAYLNAAAIASNRQQTGEALRWIENILSFAPDHPGALQALASTQREAEDYVAAEQSARRAVAAAPQSREAVEMLGQVLQALNRSDEARTVFEQAASLPGPKPESALERLAILELELGHGSKALELFDQALTLNPSAASVWFNRAEIKKFSTDDADIAAMEKVLETARQQGVGRNDSISLLFALAKAWLDVGQDDHAFAALAEGNRLKRETFAYDGKAVGQWLGRIRKAFTKKQFARLKGQGDPSETPIFIVGMPRSGTTLVEQILAAHPLVYGAGELKLIQSMVDQISPPGGTPLGFPQLLENTAPEDLPRLARHYLSRVEELAPGRARVVDKMPANFLYAGFIHMMMPNARIIHCRRDPVDTCLSCYTKLFSGEQKFAYDLAELGHFYKGYERLTDYWASVLPADRFMEVHYEDVVGDLESQARRLLDFCGLEWDDACLSFHKVERVVRTASVTQVRQPIYRGSMGRWKKYAGHLKPLLDALEIEEGA